jgi:hypothetical protein
MRTLSFVGDHFFVCLEAGQRTLTFKNGLEMRSKIWKGGHA